jgi:antitoxin (DNA-binding transcriptional repressor) of toxin-antitoxin stability system
MAVIHISESEAVRDLPALLDRVREGAEILIESDDQPIAVLRSPNHNPGPIRLSEALRRAEARGSKVTLDDQFGRDLEEVIRSNGGERFVDPWESS